MNCHVHIEALVDIARGSGSDSEAERAALTHMAACRACAERLEREQELTIGLRELAAATPAPDGQAMELRLLNAFAERAETAQRQGQVSRVRRRQTLWWPLASAAVLVLSASVTWYVLRTHQNAPPPSAVEQAADLPAQAPLAAHVVQPIPPATVSTVAAPPRRRPRHPDAPVEEARLFSDFIALPEASALPDFESGRIVRIEIPVTMLPAYGLHMVPQAAPADVEADLLVGQDGLPRAIRLASSISNDQE